MEFRKFGYMITVQFHWAMQFFGASELLVPFPDIVVSLEKIIQ